MGWTVTKLRIALGLAALAAAVGVLQAEVLQPAGRESRADDPFAGIPDLTIRYYEISGRTAEEIRRSMDRLRPADPETGERFDGYTRWDMRWFVPGRPEGPCRLDRATVTVDLTVTLPRLVDPAVLPPATLARWQRFTTWLEAHEAGHARIAVAGRDDVLDAIRRAECATAPEAARAAMEAVEERSRQYDSDSEDDWELAAPVG